MMTDCCMCAADWPAARKPPSDTVMEGADHQDMQAWLTSDPWQSSSALDQGDVADHVGPGKHAAQTSEDKPGDWQGGDPLPSKGGNSAAAAEADKAAAAEAVKEAGAEAAPEAAQNSCCPRKRASRKGPTSCLSAVRAAAFRRRVMAVHDQHKHHQYSASPALSSSVKAEPVAEAGRHVVKTAVQDSQAAGAATAEGHQQPHHTSASSALPPQPNQAPPTFAATAVATSSNIFAGLSCLIKQAQAGSAGTAGGSQQGGDEGQGQAKKLKQGGIQEEHQGSSHDYRYFVLFYKMPAIPCLIIPFHACMHTHNECNAVYDMADPTHHARFNLYDLSMVSQSAAATEPVLSLFGCPALSHALRHVVCTVTPHQLHGTMQHMFCAHEFIHIETAISCMPPSLGSGAVAIMISSVCYPRLKCPCGEFT